MYFARDKTEGVSLQFDSNINHRLPGIDTQIVCHTQMIRLSSPRTERAANTGTRKQNSKRDAKKEKQTATHAAPAHSSPSGGPATTSQYVPGGNVLVNSAFQSASALLIATNPTLPRANAICELLGETHALSGFASADGLLTVLWNPTMPAIAGQRCWQNLYGG